MVHVDLHDLVPVFQGHLDGIGEPFGDAFPDHQPVHHQVGSPRRRRAGQVGQLQNLPVHLDTDEPGPDHGLDLSPVFARLVARQRREHLNAGAGSEFQQVVHHLLHRMHRNGAAATPAVGPPHVGEQQPQVVMNLGQRAHRGPRVFVEAALRHGDGRGKPLNGIHVGSGQRIEKLTRVGGQGLHVVPLPLCIDGVEGQRGFARAGNPRDHHELVAGDLDVDVLEVVDASALDDDVHEN